MATMQTLLDDLNDRLGDANNAAGAGEANKMRWINHGIRAMWPKIWIAVQDDSVEILADTYAYDVPTAVGTNSEIVRIEVESGDGTDIFTEITDIDELPLRAFRTIQTSPHIGYTAGARLRITAIRPLAVMDDVTDVYEGYPITEELPVLYAMYMATSRRHEDRIDHTRYSTVAAANRVDIGEIEGASLFWLSQFDSMLERLAMPWPASIG